MKIINLYAGEQLALADMLYGMQSTPRGAQSDVLGGLVAANGPQILAGFEATLTNGSLTVASGRALLTLREGNTLTPNLFVGEDAEAVVLDVTKLAAGDYGVYVTFASKPTDLDERSAYASQSAGYTQDAMVYTRQAPGFAAKLSTTALGPEYVRIAQVTLPDGAVQDCRPLLFEGRADQGFAPTWGSEADRSQNRGQAPISDLRTMIEALKVAIGDVKGGPWYAPYAGGTGGGASAPAHNPISVGDGPPVDSPSVQPLDVYLRKDTLEIFFAQ